MYCTQALPVIVLSWLTVTLGSPLIFSLFSIGPLYAGIYLQLIGIHYFFSTTTLIRFIFLMTAVWNWSNDSVVVRSLAIFSLVVAFVAAIGQNLVCFFFLLLTSCLNPHPLALGFAAKRLNTFRGANYLKFFVNNQLVLLPHPPSFFFSILTWYT